jgi:chromosome segregation ATPase
MKTAPKFAVILLLLSTVAFARRRDPLTEAETDQLREARLEPAKRFKLFGKFAGARLDSIDQSLNDPKQAQERPAKIHDLLEDFSSIVDEINDNLDMYQSDTRLDDDQHKQLKKGLKELIAEEGKLRARLRTLQHDMESDPKIKAESQAYIFALQDADSALRSSLETAKQYLTEKEEEKPQKK